MRPARVAVTAAADHIRARAGTAASLVRVPASESHVSVACRPASASTPASVTCTKPARSRRTSGTPTAVGDIISAPTLTWVPPPPPLRWLARRTSQQGEQRVQCHLAVRERYLRERGHVWTTSKTTISAAGGGGAGVTCGGRAWVRAGAAITIRTTERGQVLQVYARGTCEVELLETRTPPNKVECRSRERRPAKRQRRQCCAIPPPPRRMSE
jgi:hypothetical protein